jgi:hypothetical protein
MYLSRHTVDRQAMTQELHDFDLARRLHDPIAQLLLENSNLTSTQLETLLIRFQKDQNKEITDSPWNLRQKGSISKGSFSRSLLQARNNVIRSIYTIFLLAYLGFFDDARLESYLDVGNQLRELVFMLRERKNADSVKEDVVLKILPLIRQELQEALQRLASSRSLSSKATKA